MNGPSGHDGHAHGGLGLGVGMPHGVYGLNFDNGHFAGDITYDAIIVGHSFSAPSHAPNIDATVSGHGVSGVPEGTMEGNGPSFDVPIDAGRTTFGLLVVGSGASDWETKVRTELTKLGLAECFNLQLPKGLVTPPQRYEELLPINFTSPKVKVTDPVMPKNFYPGATGATTIFRTNWEVGNRSLVDIWLGKPATRKVGCRTCLEVDVTVWFYAEAGDYEIRIVVKATGGKDRSELMEHLKAARAFCQTMLKTLQATPPSSDARAWREQAAAGR
jgi:hypothetical protein